MTIKNNYLENEFCEYWIDENGIIHEIFKSTFGEINLEIAKIITRGRLEVSNGIYRPLFVELGDAVKMDRAATRYFSSGESMYFLNATGILIKDQIEKFGVNIYIKFFTPKVPTKVFTSKEKALFWLLQHRTDALN